MKLNLKLLKQAATLAKPYWASKEGRKAWWQVAVLIALLLVGDLDHRHVRWRLFGRRTLEGATANVDELPGGHGQR